MFYGVSLQPFIASSLSLSLSLSTVFYLNHKQIESLTYIKSKVKLL